MWCGKVLDNEKYDRVCIGIEWLKDFAITKLIAEGMEDLRTNFGTKKNAPLRSRLSNRLNLLSRARKQAVLSSCIHRTASPAAYSDTAAARTFYKSWEGLDGMQSNLAVPYLDLPRFVGCPLHLIHYSSHA